MPGPYFNVIRPDGTTLQVTAEEAARLESLGYKRETDEQAQERVTEAERDRYYSTGGQRLVAGVEGLASGATLGLSDIGLDYLGADTAERAQANPGLRTATELLGAVGPSLIAPGSGTLAELAATTPAGRVARLGEQLGTGLAEGKIARGAIAGATEGVAQSVGADIAHARLQGDPVTVESVLASAGWGVLYGAGAGGLAGGVASKIENRAARRAAEELDRATLAAAQEAVPGSYARLRDAVGELAGKSSEMAGTVERELTQAERATLPSSSRGPTFREGAEYTVPAQELADRGYDTLSVAGRDPGKLRKARIAIAEGQKDAIRVSIDSDGRLFVEDGVNRLRAAVEAEAPIRVQLSKAYEPEAKFTQELGEQAAAKFKGAAEEAQSFNAVARSLDLPPDLAGFTKMAPAKAEETFAALEHGLKTKAPELEPLRTAITKTIEDYVASVGVGSTEASPVANLRAAWAAQREAASVRSLNELRKAAQGGGKAQKGPISKIVNMLAGAAGAKVGYKYGGGFYGASVGSKAARSLAGAAMGAVMSGGDERAAIVGGVLAARAGVMARIDRAVMKYGEKAARVGSRVAIVGDARRRSKESPLAIRMDGTRDPEPGTAKELAARRLDELHSALPTVHDTLYRAVEPLDAAGHPELAQGLHRAAVGAVDALVGSDFIPRDPGTVMSRGRSFWRANEVQVAMLERAWGVFHDPVGTLEKMASAGDFPALEIGLLEKTAPALLGSFRDRILEKMAAEPQWLAGMTYQEQVGLSRAVGVPLHSSMRPQFIAAQQAMFANQPKPQPPGPGEAGSGVRGPDGSPLATNAQKSTER